MGAETAAAGAGIGSMIGPIGTALGALGGTVLGFMGRSDQNEQARQNREDQEKWNSLNYQNQLEQQRYMKDQQLLTQQREDNSVQRRVADLRKAGLSPVLAAGAGAAASAPIQVGQVQRDVYDRRENFEYPVLINSMTQAANLAQTLMGVDVASAQINQLNANTQGKIIENAYADAKARETLKGMESHRSYTNAQAGMTAKMLHRYSETGVHPMASSVVNDIANVLDGMSSKMGKRVKDSVTAGIEKVKDRAKEKWAETPSKPVFGLPSPWN